MSNLKKIELVKELKFRKWMKMAENLYGCCVK